MNFPRILLGISLFTMALAAPTVSQAAAATQLIFTNLSTAQRSNEPGTFRLEAQDNTNTKDPNYRGTVRFTSSDPAATLPPDYRFTAADAGAHDFPRSFILRATGIQTITAADTVNATINGSGWSLVTARTASLAGSSTYNTGTNPFSVTSGDFNADGRPDLAVANSNSNTVSILLGNGDGTLQTKVDYVTGSNPVSVTVGDFNADGKPDLATANSGAHTISILLGNGNGTFQAKVDYATGTGPFSVTSGDFNSDGKLDLAVANNGSSSVSILLGNGNGSFQNTVDYATGTNPRSVTVGDLNGDGKPDLAVANYGSNTVSVLLGNGDGTFQDTVDYATGNLPTSVAMGDFNGDGKLDLAVANDDSITVSIFLGNGDGTFQAKVDYTPGANPYSVTVGDFNADGKPDLAVSNYGYDGKSTISILLGNGDGTFQPKVDYATGNRPISVAVVDFNGDGRPDLATADNDSNKVSIFLGNGNGTFQSKVDYATGSTPYSVTEGDFNGDGRPDLAVANHGSSTVSILLGNGNGTFQAKTDYATGANPRSVIAGDFNGDGKPDLAVANTGSDTVSILLGNGDGTFLDAVDYATGSYPISVTVGDFNADGKLDLAVANSAGGGNTVSILLGNGDGTFQPKVDYVTGSGPISVTVGDFNADGKLDLGVANGSSNTVSILLGNGNGTFQAKVDYATGATPYSIIVEDFNGDGKPDLAVANMNSYTLSILLGNGNGTFQNKVDYTTGIDPTSVTAGDFNADGKPDLAVTNLTSSTVSIYVGNGDGTFQARVDYITGYEPFSITAADFNGDGKSDLAAANKGAHTISILLGNSSPSWTGSYPAAPAVTADTAQLLLKSPESGSAYLLALTSGSPSPTAAQVKAGKNASGVLQSANLRSTISLPAATEESYSFTGLSRGAAYTIYAVMENSFPTLQATPLQMQIATRADGLCGSANGVPTGSAPAANLCDFGTPSAVTGGDPWVWNCTGSDSTASCSAPLPTWPLTIAFSGNSSGTVNYSFGGSCQSSSGSCSESINEGTAVTLTTTPDSGAFFAGWSGDCSGTGSCQLTMTSAKSVTASFKQAATCGASTGETFNSLPATGLCAIGTSGTVTASAGNWLWNCDVDGLNIASCAAIRPAFFMGVTRSGNGTLQGKVDYAAGSGPWSVNTGDFNGDGKQDLAVANFYSNTVSILLGNGDGTFQPKVDYATGSYPNSVTVGDFNGDGRPDLAVMNYYSNTVSVLLGNSNGTFQAKADYATGNYPNSVTAGDFNGDSRLDLAVANYGSNTVSILFGNGDGTFQPKVDHATGTSPYSVAAGDINGDGKLDLVITDSSPVVINKDRTDYNNTISMFLGNGNGTYQSRVASIIGYSNYSPDSSTVIIGDFNTDGKADLAVVRNDSSTLSTLLGNGNGTFQTKVDYNTGGFAHASVKVGDFNADGRQDLVLANYYNDTVSILLGNGTGTFQSRVEYTTGGYPRSVVVEDFNGDGTADLAVANTYENTLSVLLGYGNDKGRVTSVPAGIDCGSSCSENVYATDTVTLTATPDNGMAFAGWTGACSGTGSCTVTMNGARSVDAQFVPVINGSCGINNDAAVPYGPSKGLCQTGTPSAVIGNGPWSWSCTGSAGGTAASCMTTTLKHDLTTTFTGDGSITFTTGDGCTAPFACTRPFAAGQSVALYATSRSDHTFSHWTGACSGSNSPCYVTMDSAKNVGAVFGKSFPKPIIDKSTIISNLTVPAGSCNITDLKVAMDISHTHIADLQLVLRAPDGYGIPLFSNGCVSFDRYANIVGTFSDSGPATMACPPRGELKPLMPLSNFAGSNAAGTWTLEISDTDLYDYGMLNSWNLNFSCAGGSTLTYPTYVPRVWLKADAGITMDEAGKISNWADQTINKFDVGNLNAGKQPLFVSNAFNGQPAVRFDGADDYLQTKEVINLLKGSTSSSVFVVMRPDATQKQQATVFDYNSSTGTNLAMQQDAANTNLYSVYGAKQQLTDSGFQIFSNIFADGTGETAYINGQNQTSATSGTPSILDPKHFTVGNKSLEELPREFKGDIAEIIVYNQTLPQTERQAEETRLLAKYSMQFELKVIRAGDGSGTVTSLPEGINCGSSCSAPYNSGTTVTLTATPSAGSLFAGWSGDCSGTGSCTVTMNQANSVMATFDAVVNASCGTSNNTISPATPSNLCSQGSASRVTGTDPWQWTCTGKKGGSSTSCSAPFGKVALGSAYYTTFAATLAAVNQGATVKARDFAIYEDLIVNNGKSFKLQGGYDPYFSGRKGTTTINSLTVSNGTVTLDGITIR